MVREMELKEILRALKYGKSWEYISYPISCKKSGWLCNMTNDVGSCANAASTTLVEKVGLPLIIDASCWIHTNKQKLSPMI